MRALAARALHEVGSHEAVSVAVTFVDVEHEGENSHVRVGVELFFHRDQPLCCTELGCFLPFLGLRRRDVPDALRSALGLARTPDLSVEVSTHHESGYACREFGPVEDTTTVYSSEHFR